jgi:hypothetical protein
MSAALQVLKQAVPELIRNSIQHGIETALERKERGKPELGNIVATALFGKNRIELHFWDDGRGLNINDLYIQGEELELLDIIPSPDVDDIAGLLVNEEFIKQTNKDAGNSPGLINIKRALAQNDYKLLMRATSDDIEEGFTAFKCVIKKNIH